jgi:nitrogen fixation protein NifZ
MRPEFDYGDQVRVLRNVRNDGTFPGLNRGRLLVRRGSVGFVRDIGTFLLDQIVYSVHFLDEDRLVGCREAEIQPADAPWTPSCFELRDKVAAKIPLGIKGRVLVDQGEIGEVLKVLRGSPDGVSYHVHFTGRDVIQAPETALELSDDRPSDRQGPS